MWLTNYSTYPFLSYTFGLDKSMITEELYHVIPIIITALKYEIFWPNAIEKGRLKGIIPGFPNTIGCVDGVTHRRNRPGHRQSAFYRGDKGYHFVSSQVTVDFSSVIIDLETGFPGASQDMGNWNNSNLGLNDVNYFSGQENLLADGIYHGPRFITPFSQLECTRDPSRIPWSKHQRRQRQVVEWTNGYLERFKALVIRFRHSIPFQSQTIMAAAYLANRQLKQKTLNIE